ncbi:MAG TPA: response regulator [Gemmatimonadales bacterium]|nr:response regulator [Gemmatimonadales bacterium]
MEQTSRRTRPRVLLADDCAGARAVAARALGRAGCRVIVASDGFQAIGTLGDPTVSLELIVVDTEMPGMHGWEVIRFARFHRPTTPVLRLGRAGDVPPAPEFRRFEAVPVLAKPLTARAVRAAVRAVTAATAASTGTSGGQFRGSADSIVYVMASR